MNETLTALNDWLNQHPGWIPLALGLTALVESAALIGILVPGIALLYAISALAGLLEFSLFYCLAAATLGAFIGDVGSFFLGRYAHQPALRHWPFNRHPDWLQRGERFIQRYGAPSVVIGRFVGPIRPVLPFVAGMLAMPPRRFIPINAASALLWAPVYVVPGYLFGRLAQAGLQAPASAPWLNLLLLLIMVGGLLVLWGLHHWLAPGRDTYQQFNRQPHWQGLRSPLTGELPLTAAALLILCTTLFSVMTATVMLGNPVAPLDQAIASLFRSLRSPYWDNIVTLVTSVGDSANLLPLSALIAAALWRQGDRAAALHWIGAMLLLAALNHLFKTGLALPRPDYLVQPLSSFSFPSAHTSNSTLFFALCASFAAQSRPHHLRLGIYALAVLPITAIALSRLYLGVHWLTDVLGGLCLALAVCGLTRLSYSRWQQQHRFGRSEALLAATGALWMTAYLLWRFSPALASYQPLPL